MTYTYRITPKDDPQGYGYYVRGGSIWDVWDFIKSQLDTSEEYDIELIKTEKGA